MSVHSTHYDSKEEYESDLAWEYRTERLDYYDRATCRDCASWSDCLEQFKEEGYPQCETGEKFMYQFEDAVEGE